MFSLSAPRNSTSTARTRGAALFALLAVLVCAAGLIGAAGPATTPAPAAAAAEDSELSPAAVAFLQMVNTADEKKLSAAPGIRADIAKKIIEYRATGGKFKNLIELTNKTAIKREDLLTALEPYEEQTAAEALEAQRKPVPDAKTPAQGGRRMQNRTAPTTDPNAPKGAKPVDPSATSQAGPIGNVRPGFYGQLPGYEDLDKIDPLQKKEFLESVNREMCTCGCTGETVAFCLVNDKNCPVVKARAKKIYDDIISKPPH